MQMRKLGRNRLMTRRERSSTKMRRGKKGNQSNYRPISTKFAYTAIISCGTLATWSVRCGQGRSESPVNVRSTGRDAKAALCSCEIRPRTTSKRRPDQIARKREREAAAARFASDARSTSRGPAIGLRHLLSFVNSQIIALQLCFRGGW